MNNCNILRKIFQRIHLVFDKYIKSIYFKKIDYRSKIYKSNIKLNKIEISINHLSSPNFKKLDEIIPRYINKHFDFLGISWKATSKPVVNNKLLLLNEFPERHLHFSKYLLRKISNDYIYIDWQLDCISGYRWDISKYHKNAYDVVFSDNGIDIKNPWEIGRLQFLPQLAYIAKYNKAYEEKIFEEFKNVILDFYTFNPYAMGVQWACTMDVAIRAVNIIYSYNIFYTTSKNLLPDREVEQIIGNLLYLHGIFIFNNLENKGRVQNNHYLTNLCGLIHIAIFLQCPKSKKWLSFAITELINEVKKQFNADGSNFEGSTAYHCLSAEMIFYTVSFLINNAPIYANKLGEIFINNLHKIYAFTKDIIAPDNHIIQIGDNDSGHFLNINPMWIIEGSAISENTLNIDSLLKLMESILVDIAPKKIKGGKPNSLKFLNGINFNQEKIKYCHYHSYEINKFYINKSEVNLKYYEDFGLIIWESSYLWFSLFFGQVGQSGIGGHAHNDKLSMNLYINGKMVLGDPGSKTYTTNKKNRNLYRSYRNHPFAINLEENDDEFRNYNTFSFPKHFKAYVEHLTINKIQVRLVVNSTIYIRIIQIENNKLSIITYSNKEFEVGSMNREIYSIGYGR